MDIRLPAALKEVLVSENEAFKRGLQLPPIPRKPSVVDILNQYVEEHKVAGQALYVEERVRFRTRPLILQPREAG